jgi:hypothetical protein
MLRARTPCMALMRGVANPLWRDAARTCVSYQHGVVTKLSVQANRAASRCNLGSATGRVVLHFFAAIRATVSL